MAQILILDDEQPLLQSLSLELSRAGHECLLAETGREAYKLMEKRSPDLAILDVQLPDINGLEVLRRFRMELPEVPVLIMTAYASVDSAVEAIKEGAIDYLEKPLDLEELQLVVNRELNNARLRSEVEAYRRDRTHAVEDTDILGNSSALTEMRKLVEQLSSIPVETAAELPTVLIEGETGTGKDLLARHIHYSGPLRDRPFVQVNCSGLPRELVESELFGHEKGAFTGATQMKQGLFEVASGGTIFLDEIGDMPLDVQTKLLNVLENRRMRRVGGTREHHVEVRIIAATNRNLGESVRGERFRSDLYYRLKVVSIQLPSLRERGQDILLLADHFLKRYRRKYGKPDLELNSDVSHKLLQWHWPGNVRELAHAIEHLILISDGQTLPTPRFHADVTANPEAAAAANPSAHSVGPAAGHSGVLQFDFDHGDCTLEGVERILIEAALAHTRGNVSEVARILGVSRGALRHRMDKWGIRP